MSTLQERLRANPLPLPNVMELCREAADRIDALEAENAALRVDAERWRALDAMLRHPGNPMTPKYRLIRESQTFGDEHDVKDWRGEVDAARSKT